MLELSDLGNGSTLYDRIVVAKLYACASIIWGWFTEIVTHDTLLFQSLPSVCGIMQG